MKIKTTHIIIVFPLILIGLSKGETVRGSLDDSNKVRQEQSDFSKQIRQNRTQARQAEKLSKVALDRVKGNCIRTVDGDSGKEGYYQPGAIVLDSQLNEPIRPGAIICNGLGDTAVIDQSGTISDIARVTLADKAQYNQLLNK